MPDVSTQATPAHARSEGTLNPALRIFKVRRRTLASMPIAWPPSNPPPRASIPWNSLFRGWTILWIWDTVTLPWN